MGRVSRPKPTRLAAKLLQIRNSLGLSQNEMLRRLDLADGLFRSAVSGYELGTREPPLPVLLKYAQLARVCLDVLVNDELNLPKKLPSSPKHKGV
jgi:transcriptional regulator with XRE-family HTH domain